MKNSLYRVYDPYNPKDIYCSKAFVIRGDLLNFMAVTYKDGNGQPGGLAWVKYPNRVIQVFRTKKDTDASLEQKLEDMSKAIAEYYGYELEDLDLQELEDDFVFKSCLVSEITKSAIRLN